MVYSASLRYWLLLGVLGLAGCVDAYLPAVVSAPNSYLVVDGFINGNGITRILLSRSINVATSTAPPPERGAQLFILDDAGRHYTLREASAGRYLSDSLRLDPARRYQLRLTTVGATAATYASELVPLKVSPPIDKLAWQLAGTDMRFALSTHDPSQQSRYYRWSFIETWEFNSAYKSIIEYDYKKNRIVPRKQLIYTCWRTERPSTIKQGSSAQLSLDQLVDFPMLTLSSRSERFTVRYSLLVSQYTQTAEEFTYYDQLRKNTEAVGTVNDPLPIQLVGNVHRLDRPDEPVLGFVGAHVVVQQRLFIRRQDIPFTYTWQFDTPYTNCDQALGAEYRADYKPPLPPGRTYIFTDPGTNLPIEPLLGAGSPPDTAGYTGARTECVDCRLHGSIYKPSYW